LPALAAAVAGDGSVDELREMERLDDLADPSGRLARSTPQRRARSSRFRRPVSERSTTASWKTTLLTRRADRGSRATSKFVLLGVTVSPIGSGRASQTDA